MIGLVETSAHPARQSPRGPKITDLFSGAGCFGLAFESEGARLQAAFEWDPVAVATHRRNFSGRIARADLGRMAPVGRADIIIAGPPCQGFSTIGARAGGDPRNSLCLRVPKWAVACHAKIAVVENVAAFAETEECAKMRRSFENAGYATTVWILNARDYGAAQNRVRSFTICTKGIRPIPPPPLAHSATVRSAFAGLPRRPDVALGHFARPQSDQAMERMRLIPEGGDIRDLAEKAPHLVPPSWFKTGGKIVDIWGRLAWDGVSNTIRTGFLNPSRGRFLHPTANRPITFREAARLQTIPDWFLFEGTPEQLARQIGNGVPLALGRAVARQVLATL